MVLKCGNQSGNFRGKRKLIAELLQNLQNFCRQIEKKIRKINLRNEYAELAEGVYNEKRKKLLYKKNNINSR